MKKTLYFVLLGAELFLGVLLLSALWSSTLYIPCILAVVALLAILKRQKTLLAKATDAVAKRKIMRNIALAMLIPAGTFCLTYIFVAIWLIIAFTFGGF